jgi:undecaprenyl-diphosphatase
MVSATEAVILGIIQGLAEFLPISSSGHLVIAQKLMGLPTPPVAFDIWLHVATLGAIFWWLGRSLRLSVSSWKLVLVGSIPAGVAGILIQPSLENIFNSLTVVGLGLLVTGAVLLATKFGPKNRPVGYKTALLIGAAQAVAILPGVSRSGSTIAMALILGVEKQAAMRFSLLLAVPAILGAQALEIDNLFNNGTSLGINLAGGAVAFMVGLVALQFLSQILQQKKLHYFGWYCLILGGGILLWLGLSTL